MTTSWRRRGALLATLILAVGGCDNDGPLGIQENELLRAQQRWMRTGYSNTTYTLRQQRICFCGDHMITYDVTVRNGVPISVRTPTGLDVPQNWLTTFRSVEQLFAELHAGLRTGAIRQVAYDGLTGYPAILSLDPMREVSDDEIEYRTSDVAPSP